MSKLFDFEKAIAYIEGNKGKVHIAEDIGGKTVVTVTVVSRCYTVETQGETIEDAAEKGALIVAELTEKTAAAIEAQKTRKK